MDNVCDFTAAAVAKAKARCLAGEELVSREGTPLDDALKADPTMLRIDVAWIRQVATRIPESGQCMLTAIAQQRSAFW